MVSLSCWSQNPLNFNQIERDTTKFGLNAFIFIAGNSLGNFYESRVSYPLDMDAGIGVGINVEYEYSASIKLIANAETRAFLIDRTQSEKFYESVVGYKLVYEDVPNFSIIDNSFSFGFLKKIKSISQKNYFGFGPQIGINTMKKKVNGYTSVFPSSPYNSIVIPAIRDHSLLIRVAFLYETFEKRMYKKDLSYKFFGSINYSRKNFNETVQQNFFSKPNEIIELNRKINYLTINIGFCFVII